MEDCKRWGTGLRVLEQRNLFQVLVTRSTKFLGRGWGNTWRTHLKMNRGNYKNGGSL
jgi:hypothetical protein